MSQEIATLQSSPRTREIDAPVCGSFATDVATFAAFDPRGFDYLKDKIEWWIDIEDKQGRYIIGPGKSAAALSITTAQNGINVTHTTSSLIITDAQTIADRQIQTTSRIGISKGTDKLWRFYYTPY